MKFLVTGGAGFIGSALCRHLVAETPHSVVNLDKLTLAGNRSSLASVEGHPRHRFVHGDIADRELVARLLAEERPDAVLNLAAESHVDRSIDGPAAFVATNVAGTCALLETVRDHWAGLEEEARRAFRFLQVSTDEVFGSLPLSGPAFTEDSPYDPSSPYSASKAGGDHLALAFHRTFGLPVVVTHASNTYGPYHFPEKLIPLAILNGLEGLPIPVYGTGRNRRDWLHVEDHLRALLAAATQGRPGRRYNIGGGAERSNLQVVEAICDVLDRLAPRPGGASRRAAIRFVADRPGHDLRYAVDAARIRAELGWSPRVPFEKGLEETVAWFLANRAWWEPIRRERYDGRRLGLPG